MIDLGVFAVYRGIWDHPIFAKEPYTEREAWLWMVGEAAWKPTTVRVGLYSVPVARGQLAHSTRFLAERFLWPEVRVRRFLKRLASDAMVTSSVIRKVTHVTICNYDKYSFDGRKVDAASVSKVAQIREEEITKKRKKDGAEAPLFDQIEPPKIPPPPTPEKLYFDRVVEVLGKGGRSFGARILQAHGRNVALARALIEQASTKSQPAEWLGGALKRAQGSYGGTPDPSDPRSCGII